MLGVIALSALLAGRQAPPMVRMEIIFVRLRPAAAEVFRESILRHSSVPVYTKDGKPGAFAGIVPFGLAGLLLKHQSRLGYKLRGHPPLEVRSGNTASCFDGSERAIPVPAGLGSVGVQFEEFGLRGTLRPIVLRDGRIHLEAEAEVSFLSQEGGVAISGTPVLGRSTRHYLTRAEMRPGQTLVLGGLKVAETVTGQHSVPGLCQLPLVGDRFRWETMREEEYEEMILVTPSVVK
jgi:hypothetical protein